MLARAIVFEQPLQAALREEEVGPLPPGSLLVEAVCSLISTGTEMICYHGSPDAGTHWEEYARYPHHPGYSLVGRIAQVGEGLGAEWRVGQRVICDAGHRSHAVVTPGQVWGRRIPDSIPDEQAAWAILGVITQTGVRMAEHAMGDSAVVIGLGPLGQLVVQHLRLLGLEQVLAVDPVQSRLDLALQHGATGGFCGSSSDAMEFVREHTAGRLAEVVYDVTGHWAVLPTALPLARDHGKLVLLGDSPHPSKQCLTYDVVSRQVRIIGSRSSWLPPQYAAWTPQRMTELFLTYVQRGQMDVSDLTTHRARPADAAKVYSMLAAKRSETLGVLFDWTAPDS
jgi:2-desacetyl-2-hydroxyethyl bacteriochlorophyllide A dehydrogenase